MRPLCVQHGASKIQAMTEYVETVEPTMITSFTEQVVLSSTLCFGVAFLYSTPQSCFLRCRFPLWIFEYLLACEES